MTVREDKATSTIARLQQPGRYVELGCNYKDLWFWIDFSKRKVVSSGLLVVKSRYEKNGPILNVPTLRQDLQQD